MKEKMCWGCLMKLLNVYNVRVIQKFQLILTEILMEVEELKKRING